MTPIRLAAAEPADPSAKGEIGATEAKPRNRKADVPFHQVIGAGKVMDRNRARLEHAHDLRHGGRVVENVLEDLIAEAEVEGGVLERQPVMAQIEQLQSARNLGRGSFRDVPVLVEIVAPIFEHVDAEGVVATLEQGAHGVADSAAEVENPGAGRKT